MGINFLSALVIILMYYLTNYIYMYDIFKDTIPVKLVSINQVPNEYKRGGGDSGCNGKGYAVIGEQKTGKVFLSKPKIR